MANKEKKKRNGKKKKKRENETFLSFGWQTGSYVLGPVEREKGKKMRRNVVVGM